LIAIISFGGIYYLYLNIYFILIARIQFPSVKLGKQHERNIMKTIEYFNNSESINAIV